MAHPDFSVADTSDRHRQHTGASHRFGRICRRLVGFSAVWPEGLAVCRGRPRASPLPHQGQFARRAFRG